MDVERASAAQRRRGRRLRAALRHERQSIAMALAESQHHTSRGQKKARAGEEGHRYEYEAPRRQKPPPPPAFFRLFDEEDAVWGLRPACLAEPCGPQGRVQLRTVEHIADVVPMVQILDAPVPRGGEQLGDQLVEVLRKIDTRSSLQAIEVPKIFPDRAPQRLVERRPPQTAEQLVEVPTQPWYVAMVLAEKVFSKQEIRRILAGMQGRGGGGARGGLQGSRAGQNSTSYLEQIVGNPVPQGRRSGGARGGLQGSLPVQNSAAVSEQIVDIPARRGLHGFLPGQGSSSSSSRLRDDADEDFTGFFALFPILKKVRSWARTRGRNCLPSRAHPRGELMRIAMLLGDPRRLRGLWVSSSWTQLLPCPFLCISGEVPQVQFMVNGDMPFELCQPSECGLGMSLDFVDPVFSGKYSWMFVSTAPVAVLFVMSFTVPCEKVSSLLRGCLRRDVVWWLESHSRWYLRFCMGLRVAYYWKIHHLLFPVPRGRWVCLLAE